MQLQTFQGSAGALHARLTASHRSNCHVCTSCCPNHSARCALTAPASSSSLRQRRRRVTRSEIAAATRGAPLAHVLSSSTTACLTSYLACPKSYQQQHRTSPHVRHSHGGRRHQGLPRRRIRGLHVGREAAVVDDALVLAVQEEHGVRGGGTGGAEVDTRRADAWGWRDAREWEQTSGK